MLDEQKLNIPKKRNSQPQNLFLTLEQQNAKPENFPSPLQLPERAAEDDKSEVTVEKAGEPEAETTTVEAEQEPAAAVESEVVEMKVEPEVVEGPKEASRPATPVSKPAAEIPLPESPVEMRPKSQALAPLSIAIESPAAVHVEKPAEPSPTIPGGW
jgi:hypothetical protein